MKLDYPIKELKILPVSDFTTIKEAIMQTTTEEWLADTARQDNWDAHRDTESIVLKIGRTYDDSKYTAAWNLKWKSLFTKYLIPHLQGIYGEGEITRMIISKLKPKASVKEHRDTERLLHFSHRIHIPIITNKLVAFNISDKKYHLSEGTIYEISNQDRHSVVSESPQDRVHIIADYADIDCLNILRKH
jgi:hypothetical protein